MRVIALLQNRATPSRGSAMLRSAAGLEVVCASYSKRVLIRIVCAMVFVVLALDAARPPTSQLSASAYVRFVRQYQVFVSPVLARRIHCRYVPTCSQYSVEAVQKYGIIRGGVLTAERLITCVPWRHAGTVDPVP
jgi:putative membrane protein insertion efficiency factor